MRRWTSARRSSGNQCISRLLDPVVQELVGAVLAKDEPGMDGFPERRVHRLLCFPMNQGQGGDLGDIAQAGELFQRLLGSGGEPLQLAGHEIHHVVGVALGADTIDIPLPSWRGWVEREQLLLRPAR